MLPSSSFTTKSIGGLLRVLINTCSISEAFDPATAPVPHPQLRPYQAIWDTGATNSVVTQKVVDECGLKPSGMTEVHGVNFVGLSEAYLVNIVLANNVGVRSVRVTKGKLAASADVLIGMDIITLGDFAVTNLDGKTMFSFCMPSRRSLDFVAEHNRAIQQSMPRPGFRGYTQPKPKRHK